MYTGKIIIITNNDMTNDLKGVEFRYQDIFNLMTECHINGDILVEIDPYKYDNDAKKIREALKELTNSRIGDYIVISASSYVSTKEFPENEYYCEAIDPNCDKNNKNELPFDEIITRQNKILEDAGFKNINKYCKLEFSEPHIWAGNEDGEKIIKYLENIG